MAASGQTRKIRACPLHVCFTPEPGRFGAPAEPSEKGHQRKDSSRLPRMLKHAPASRSRLQPMRLLQPELLS